MVDHKPPTLSIKDLSKAVDHAVRIASEKHKVEFSPEFRINPGTIIGRQLLQRDIPVSQAQQIAAEITQHLSNAKIGGASFAGGSSPLEPFVLGGRNILICGFLPGPIWELRE